MSSYTYEKQEQNHQTQNNFVEQSYLMSAFSLAKLKQNKSAANAYTEAETYYGNRVNSAENAVVRLSIDNDWKNFPTLLQQQTLVESPEAVALAKHLRVLANLLSYPLSQKSKSSLSESYSKLFIAYQNDTRKTLDKKLAILNSYLNQSRFGLTKLYDTP